MPSKCKSGGRKSHQNGKVTTKSAAAQIGMKKEWWQKVPSKHESGGQKEPPKLQNGGKKCHHISYCGGTLTTTYHISGAGTPAKTKKM